jgi:hypothetical protein
MKYVINDIIKRLLKVQKEGKTLITERELIQIATPKINNIDEVIRMIDKAIETIKNTEYPIYNVTFTDMEKYNIASRQTLYRWVDRDIIKVSKMGKYTVIDLFELKEIMLNLKEKH